MRLTVPPFSCWLHRAVTAYAVLRFGFQKLSPQAAPCVFDRDRSWFRLERRSRSLQAASGVASHRVAAKKQPSTELHARSTPGPHVETLYAFCTDQTPRLHAHDLMRARPRLIACSKRRICTVRRLAANLEAVRDGQTGRAWLALIDHHRLSKQRSSWLSTVAVMPHYCLSVDEAKQGAT